MKPEENESAETRKFQSDPKPGDPKEAHRDYVSGGKHENKDSRDELRKKH